MFRLGAGARRREDEQIVESIALKIFSVDAGALAPVDPGRGWTRPPVDALELFVARFFAFDRVFQIVRAGSHLDGCVKATGREIMNRLSQEIPDEDMETVVVPLFRERMNAYHAALDAGRGPTDAIFVNCFGAMVDHLCGPGMEPERRRAFALHLAEGLLAHPREALRQMLAARPAATILSGRIRGLGRGPARDGGAL